MFLSNRRAKRFCVAALRFAPHHSATVERAQAPFPLVFWEKQNRLRDSALNRLDDHAN
jgi:hypothetical protein